MFNYIKSAFMNKIYCYCVLGLLCVIILRQLIFLSVFDKIVTYLIAGHEITNKLILILFSQFFKWHWCLWTMWLHADKFLESHFMSQTKMLEDYIFLAQNFVLPSCYLFKVFCKLYFIPTFCSDVYVSSLFRLTDNLSHCHLFNFSYKKFFFPIITKILENRWHTFSIKNNTSLKDTSRPR